jgi:aspartate-alanine antiporter
MNWASHIFKAAPETALFVALALGHALGRLRLGSFSLGGVAGSLLVALALGKLTSVELPETLKAVFFALFIYAVGFKSGPDFFGGLNASSVKLVVSSVVQCVTALLVVVLVARWSGLSKGYAAGLGAGALTQTAMLGTAAGALSRLGLAPEQLTLLSSQMAVGFAITYIFGTVGTIIFLQSFAPRLLRVDLKQAARELEGHMSGSGQTHQPGQINPFVPVVARAFEVSAAAGCPLRELTSQFGRASVERILRDGSMIEPAPEVVLKTGDVVGIAGRLEAVLAAGRLLGQEIESQKALSFSARAATIVLAGRQVLGWNLGRARALLDEANLNGVYLVSLKRQGLPLPILAGTELQRGDVAEIVGRPEEVERAIAMLGWVETGGGKSDLAYHALAIVLGTLLGLLSASLGGIPVTLGIGGGVLVSGLCFGWWHARYPAQGALPGPAQWILSEFGLSAFAAAVGLSAGPKAVAAIQEHGVALLLVGAVVTLVPLIVALCFGRFVLRLNPVILLGALCGGQTVAAALNAVNEVADSITPVLGFTVTYAISNVLLAVWGPLIVALT